MPVTKNLCERYVVSEDARHGEQAAITLQCWQRNIGDGDIYYCGTIQIHSTYGDWAYTWTACASPFKQFLTKIEFDYAFNKFMPGRLERFNAEASLTMLRQKIVEQRRHGWISKAEAREIWSALDDAEGDLLSRGAEGYILGLLDIGRDLSDGDPKEWLAEAWELTATEPDRSAVAFWERLWPLFIAELRKEVHASAGATA